MDDAAPVLVWLRRDLRLTDNPALDFAAAGGRPVIPFFVLDDATSRGPGVASRWWLDRSLRSLAADLESIGGRLILRRGDAAAQVEEIATGTRAQAVVWNRLYDPRSLARDARLKARLGELGVEARSFNAALLTEPGQVTTREGTAFKVFTPWWRAARSAMAGSRITPPPGRLRGPASWPASDAIGDWRLSSGTLDGSPGFDWRPGEAAALEALDDFIEGPLCDYVTGRDRPDLPGTSRLSPHLSWGEIGPRQVRQRIAMARDDGTIADSQAEKFLAELGWRDFNHQLLFYAEDLERVNLDRRFDAMPWRDDDADFRAWTRGATGYPVVDAAMRQLQATGWMHNRMRMVVASFLIKDLLIDWRRGEAWFRDALVDADPANNPANWQWAAGSGADAQPFFRIFNPVVQGERHDPTGAYVRRWVPELARLPDAVIHAPWTADASVLARCGVELGVSYPNPVVNHGSARKRALEALRTIRATVDK